MAHLLSFLQIGLALLLIGAILLQQRGTELGGAFGGESGIYHTRRGIEKFLFYLTIVLAFAFVIITVVNTIRK